MKEMKRYFIALLILLPGLCLAEAWTTNRCSFPGYTVEVTVNQLNLIQRFKIVDTNSELPKTLFDKSSFADWTGAIGYYGMIQTGDTFCLITRATGTGVAQFYIHEYKVSKKVDIITPSRCVYYWTDLESQGGLHIGKSPSLFWERNTNDLWNPYITLRTMNGEPTNAPYTSPAAGSKR